MLLTLTLVYHTIILIQTLANPNHDPNLTLTLVLTLNLTLRLFGLQ